MKYLRLITILVLLGMVCACKSAEPTTAPEENSVVETTVTAEEVVNTPAPSPAEPTTLIIAMNIDGILTMDPGHAFEIECPVFFDAVYDTLVETQPESLNDFTPRLASSWEISDDGLVYTFHLLPDVKFASGNPVTAEDFRFSWQRLINLKGDGSWYLRMVESIQAVDDLTLQVTLTQPSPEFMSSVSSSMLSGLDSKLLKEHGGTDAEDADVSDTAQEWLDQNSAGSGAYVQTSWTPKSEIVFEANPNYFRGAPNIDKIIFKNVTDPTTALQMLQKGEVDLIHTIDKDLVEQAKADSNINVVIGQTYNTQFLGLLNDPEISEPLTDVRVRQAVLLSIDFDGMINSILNGYAVRAPSLIPQGVSGVDASMIQPRDLDKARALLKEAGYENGFPVDLSWGTSSEKDLIAAKIQADLAEVGIDVTLRPLELSVYYSEARSGKLAMRLGGWSTDRMDVSNWVPFMAYPDSSLGAAHKYDNPESSRLADLISSEMNPQKRAEYVTEIQKVWIDDAWATTLYQYQQVAALNNKVHGFVFHPFVFCSLRNLSFGEPQAMSPAAQATNTPVPAETTAPVEEPSAEPTTLIVAMNIDGIVTLDLGFAFEPEDPIFFDAFYDPLIETLPDNLTEYKPRLAESWEISEDGLVYTFHIRPGVKFASGNPLTAEDFRFSFMRMMNLKQAGSWYLRMVKSIEAPDDLTLIVTLNEPSAEIMSSFNSLFFSATDSKLIKEHGGTDAADADTTDTAKDWLDQNSAGTGPYILTSWTPKSEIVLEKNPNYWREGPTIDKIIFKNITDPTVAIQMLQTGEADIVYNLDIDLADMVKSDPDLTLVQGQLYNQEYIAMTSNPELSEPLSNKLVRQAVIQSIDYDGIINGILNGYAIKAPVMLPLGVPGSDPEMIVERDLDKAKELLAEAGYPDGFPVELTYGTSAERDTVAAKIQADLAEVGIEVTLRPLEMSVYYSEARAQKLAFLIGPWSTDRLDPSNWVPYMAYPDTGLANRIFYDNPVSVELADKIAREVDPVKNADLVKEIQQVWMDDAWGQILYQPQQLVAMRNSVQGFQFHPFTWCILKDLSLSD